MRRVISALAIAGALAGCSNNDSVSSVPRPPGCDLIATTHTCTSDPASSASTCAAAGGTWLETGCPLGADLVGICDEAGGVVVNYYSSDYRFYATNDAAWACAFANGIFYPEGDIVTGSCDLRSTSYDACVDLEGTVSDVTASGSSGFCTMLGGTWSTTDACTASGRTATCSFVDNGVQTDVRYYYELTADQAQCTGTGDTWTPG